MEKSETVSTTIKTKRAPMTGKFQACLLSYPLLPKLFSPAIRGPVLLFEGLCIEDGNVRTGLIVESIFINDGQIAPSDAVTSVPPNHNGAEKTRADRVLYACILLCDLLS